MAVITARQVGTFAGIGVVSTLTYSALFLLLRSLLPAPVANAVALLLTALGNTAANRRLTFGRRGRAALGRDHLAGLAAFGAALTITSAAIALLDLVAPGAGHLVELAVLVTANLVATTVRFLVLHTWFTRRAPAHQDEPAAPPALSQVGPTDRPLDAASPAASSTSSVSLQLERTIP